MFNTASPNQHHVPNRAFELRPEISVSSFKRKSSCNVDDELDFGHSVGMQRTDSHDAKRRRIPLRKDALLLPSPSYQANSLAFAVFDHNWQQQEQSTLQHPLSQQSPQQTFQFHANPSYNHNDQQIQLNTPPLDSPSGFELPSQRNNHIDDDMVIDDDCQGAFDTTSHHFPQHHSHTAPPSPISPGLVADNGHDDNIDPIKWEGTKNKGYPRDAYEDPNANLWTGGRSHRKNMDGHVKGFKMGYLEGCEKCRVRARGHFGHFIMADSI